MERERERKRKTRGEMKYFQIWRFLKLKLPFIQRTVFGIRISNFTPTIANTTRLLSNLMDLRNNTQSLKRKLDWTEEDEVEEVTTKPRRLDLPTDISNRIHLLKSSFSSSRSDRSSANCALFVLSEFAKDGTVFRFLHSVLFNLIF